MFGRVLGQADPPGMIPGLRNPGGNRYDRARIVRTPIIDRRDGGVVASAQDWIKILGLIPHPEGGWYAETYRSPVTLAAEALPTGVYSGPRAVSTAIYYLLAAGQVSRWHRLKSDEFWHFYAGGPLELGLSPDGSTGRIVRVGNEPASGERPQVLVPANWWFAARPAGMLRGLPADPGLQEDLEAFTLVGCTVAPGFDFADFAFADLGALRAAFPAHRDLIDHFMHT
jgi:uncharacterized protein